MTETRRQGEAAISSQRRDTLAVGLFIPVSGAAGIWGPSCRACADLAAMEINNAGGIDGREVTLEIVDAGGDPDTVADEAQFMLEDRAMDALVGMHTSDVRSAVAGRVAGRVPYVYTPLYEGGEAGRGVFCIGETPARQLLPGLDWLSTRYDARSWYLLGNDYVWPRTTHAMVRRHLAGGERDIVGERYVPFGTERFDAVLDEICARKPDALLLSLVGGDSVHFNRAFARAGLPERMLRFSCAVEENMLLAIGADNLDGMFVASGYFGALSTRENNAFRERYHGRFGERAPTLNTIGQSLYEGMHFLNALSATAGGGDWRRPPRAIAPDSVRNGVFEARGAARGLNRAPVYLAEAQGHDFRIIGGFT